MAASLSQPETAAAALRAGQIVAFPTETVYGLGADARNPDAVARIFAIKGRPPGHPLIVHLADASELSQWSNRIPESARRLADHFWPGPLTLILPGSLAPSEVTGGQDSIGLRVPRHPVAQALLKAFRGGIAAPSANRFGRVSPTLAHHVRDELGSAVDVLLEGGACEVGLESTILSLVEPTPKLLRHGAITRSDMEAVLGRTIVLPGDEETLRAPGLLASHYAPLTPLQLMSTQALSTLRTAPSIKVAVLLIGEHPPPPRTLGYSMPADPKAYGNQLYARLRALDQEDYDLIIAERPPATEAWGAVLDRLTRASHQSSS